MTPARRKKSPVVLGVSLLLLSLNASPVRAASTRAAQKKLHEVQEAIKKKKEQVRKTQAAEENTMRTLAAINHRLAGLDRELNIYQWNLKHNQGKKKKVEKKLKTLNAKVLDREGYFRARVRALYKLGEDPALSVALTSDDLTDFLIRMKYLRAVVLQDRRTIQKFGTEQEALERSRNQLRRLKAAILAYQKKAESTQNKIADERAKKNVLLAEIRRKKAGYLHTQKELEATAARLQNLIQDLARRQAARRALRARREQAPPLGHGKLPWPVKGEVTARFGKTLIPKYDVYTFNKGIDIAAASRSPIRSVAAGEVLYADPLKGYGNLLIIDHGRGLFTVYAHLAGFLVKVGERVHAGQIIGRLGNGNAREDPSLYFEVRLRGKPEDPLNWLKKTP